MLNIFYTKAFERDIKRLRKQGKELDKLKAIVKDIGAGKTLDTKYRDHNLTGNWSGFRECHIDPDWLLIYRIRKEKLILILSRTGSHSDLF